MLPSKEKIEMMQKKFRTIMWVVSGLFLCILIVSYFDLTGMEKRRQTERQEEERKQLAADKDYVVWFENHYSRADYALTDYKEKRLYGSSNELLIADQQVRYIIEEAYSYDVSRNSRFASFDLDYDEVFYEYEDALNSSNPFSYKTTLQLNNTERLEEKVLEEFKILKEDIYKDL